MVKFRLGAVVQFNEKHKWCGCFGFVNEIKECGNDVRYMVGVPVPQQGIAYIFTMQDADEICPIGIAALLPDKDGEE